MGARVEAAGTTSTEGGPRSAFSGGATPCACICSWLALSIGIVAGVAEAGRAALSPGVNEAECEPGRTQTFLTRHCPGQRRSGAYRTIRFAFDESAFIKSSGMLVEEWLIGGSS